ncbi:37S ribosomal protein S24 [Fusarium oxysporum f. sp. albedinis]|nr:37S ribosomal protein S24 [Fusarium oxysporum f. sp. albedinis]
MSRGIAICSFRTGRLYSLSHHKLTPAIVTGGLGYHLRAHKPPSRAAPHPVPEQPAGANEFPANKTYAFIFSPFIVQLRNYFIILCHYWRFQLIYYYLYPFNYTKLHKPLNHRAKDRAIIAMQAITGVLQLPYRSLTALLRARIVTPAPFGLRPGLWPKQASSI